MCNQPSPYMHYIEQTTRARASCGGGERVRRARVVCSMHYTPTSTSATRAQTDIDISEIMQMSFGQK